MRDVKFIRVEQALVEDCRKILDRGGFYSWRYKIVVKAFIEKRWVFHFSTKNGVPDIALSPLFGMY